MKKKVFKMRSFKKIVFRLRSKAVLLLGGGVNYARLIGVKVGDNCRIGSREFGSEPFLITIGNNVTITLGVKFITHDGSGYLHVDKKGRRYNFRRILIGNNVFVGVDSIIMPGVKICDDVIVAPGSIITKSVPKGCIIGGVPAKIIGDFWQHKEKCLANWASDLDMAQPSSFKDKVNTNLTSGFKDFLNAKG